MDGTLTPSRGTIDGDFAVFFSNFCAENEVYLVTGSDRDKTIEQIGEEIYSLCKRVYNCSGSDVWEGETRIRTNSWTLPKDTEEWLAGFLKESKFTLRTGLHFEHRTGMCNFSIVGRNATLGERKLYSEYDKQTNERNTIARMLIDRFKYVDAKVGGETGIDIFPKGADKSQILVDFKKTDRILFFGDAMDKDGNDYPLAVALKNGGSFGVSGWQETWKHLRDKNIYKGSV